MLLSRESIDAYPLKFAENTLAHLRAELQSQAFSLMNQSLPGGIVGTYPQPGFPLYFINDGISAFLGYSRDELREQTGGMGLNIIHPDDRDFVRRTDCVVQTRADDGGNHWNSISMTALRDALDRPIRAVGLIEDITRRKEAERAYAREEQFRRAVLADAMASYDINFSQDKFEHCQVSSPLCVVVRAGDAYERLMRDVTMGQLIDEDCRAFLQTFSRANVLRAFESQEREIRLEYRFIQPGGAILWLETTLRLLLDAESGDQKGFMYVMNIDSRKKAQLALTRKSECDSLTGVYNKSTAEARIRDQLKTDEGIQTGVFMMIDLDHFKDINDTYGHPFGDDVLVRAARAVAENFRESDIVGRLGGDEFCVFFRGIRTRRRIEEAARSLRDAFRTLFTPTPGAPGPSCSIGIALTGGMAKSFGQLYAEADRALYQAKKDGRGGYAFLEE